MEKDKRAPDYYKIITVGLLVLSQIVSMTLAYANLSNGISSNKEKVELIQKLLEKHEAHPEYHNNMVKSLDSKYMTHKDGKIIVSDIKSSLDLLTQELRNLSKKVDRIK